MMPAARDRLPRSNRVRLVALVALTALGCATVRVPATELPPSVRLHGDVAEPQVELWIESGQDVSPAEAAQAAAESRAALHQALASRNLDAGEQLLVVRAQGVSRTGSRRADQRAAVAGIVVAAVAIVAVVVVLIVASKGKGGGIGKVPVALPRAAAPARLPGAVRAPGAVRVPVSVPAVRPAPPRVATAPRAARPAPGGHVRGGVAVGVDTNVDVMVEPSGGSAPASWIEPVSAAPPSEPFQPEGGDEVTELALPPPRPLDAHHRGFFAKDATILELTLVDRATRTPLWTKTVESESDPRDPRALQALLERGLDDPAGWAPAEAAR